MNEKPGYWAIKTTEGGSGNKDHWDDFVREHVVAVGWRRVKIDPTPSKSRINSAGGSEDIARDVREERACAGG